MCVWGSGRECKGEVAGQGLEMIFWGAVYGAIVRADTWSKGNIPKKREGRRGKSFLKNAEQEVFEKRLVELSLSCLGDTGHRWSGETGWWQGQTGHMMTKPKDQRKHGRTVSRVDIGQRRFGKTERE